MITDNIRKIRNIIRSRHIYGELLQSQYFNRETIKILQTNKLKHILEVAVNTVPFYKHLRSKINFKNFSIEELQKFPVITKQEMNEQKAEFLSSEALNRKAYLYKTSGSTGDRFSFYLPYFSSAFEDATAFRAWGMGKDYHYKPRDAAVFLRSYAPTSGQKLYKRNIVHNYLYLSAFDIRENTLEQYVRLIEESGAHLMRAYASSVYLFTLLLQKHNIKLPQIRIIATASETLLPLYRDTVEEYWGIPILDWYGQNERTIIVQQCWAGSYHNNDEYGIVELDHDNQMIATSLNNDVMPFIRYATGDFAEPSEEKFAQCECGRTLSIPIKRIEGRSDDLIVKSDGSRTPTINIYTAMHTFAAVKQFSIVQNADRSLLIQLSLESPVDESYLNKIRDALSFRVGNLTMDFALVNEIERDRRTGKQRAIRSYAN